MNIKSFLAEDQLKYLQASQASRNKGIVWTLHTIRQAFQIRYICGAHGYEFIRSLHYPLPSYQTLQPTVLKSYGGSDHGLTLPSQNWIDLLRTAETLFLSCKCDFVRDTDVQQFLLSKCSSMLNNSNIPVCHDLGVKVLNKFFQTKIACFWKGGQ